MTTFQIIIIVTFAMVLSAQFVAAIVRDCFKLAVVFAFEIIAFAYLVNTLM